MSPWPGLKAAACLTQTSLCSGLSGVEGGVLMEKYLSGHLSLPDIVLYRHSLLELDFIANSAGMELFCSCVEAGSHFVLPRP